MPIQGRQGRGANAKRYSFADKRDAVQKLQVGRRVDPEDVMNLKQFRFVSENIPNSMILTHMYNNNKERDPNYYAVFRRTRSKYIY